MKKLISAATLLAMVGLGFYGYSNTNVDSVLGTEPDTEKTYIVKVAGDINENNEVAAKNRKQVLSALGYKLEENSYEVTSVYDTVYNGFAIKTSAENADILAHTLNVVSVNEEHVYAVPTGDETPVEVGGDSAADEAAIKKMKMANYSAETMNATEANLINAGATASKKGAGITMGILDTGLYMDQVEGTEARATFEKDYEEDGFNAAAFKPLAEGTNIALDQTKIAAVGYKTGSYTYLNSKIPFCYDFAGNDIDVDPTVSGSEHGTHVASLAGANGDDFQGIAPDAQICVMKVFGDNDAGAGTTAIISALDAAVKLGLDEINMSLGTDLVDNTDVIDSDSYKALQAAFNAGVICNISAGNAGKSNFSSGDYSDFTTDTCEPGILGSYANFDEVANIVASSSPKRAFYSSIMKIQKNGSSVVNVAAYSDQVKTSTTQTFTKDHLLTDLLNGETSGEFDYIYVPGYGTSSDFAAMGNKDDEGIVDTVKGKVAVVNRGQTTFVSKAKAAENAGATALVVINNDPSVSFNFSMAFNDYTPGIPVVFVFQNTTSFWGTWKTLTAEEKANPSINNSCGYGKVSLAVNTVADASDGDMISTFSSDGPSANLDIGPTLSAPGTSIMGAVNALTDGETSGLKGYDNYSGTSMAAPNLTGAMALVLGERLPENGSVFACADKDAFDKEKAKLSMKAMSTADQLMGTDLAAETSVRLQGAGRINVEGILKADSYVTTTNDDLGGYSNTEQSKAELKNSGSLYVKDADFDNAGESYIEFDYTVHNDSKVAKTYTPSLSVQIPELRVKLTHEAYAAEETDSRVQEVGYNSSVVFNEDDASTYPTFTGVPTISVNDEYLNGGYTALDGGNIVVAAGGTAAGKVKVRIDDLHIEKTFETGKFANSFSGTLKEYVKTYFKNAGGTFVEGFLKLHETTATDDVADLTMPYLGFYGDYTLGKVVEDFDFEKDNSHIYNSDLTDNFLQNLADKYAKKNAYTGSSLFATSSTISAKDLNAIGCFNKKGLANGSDYLSAVGEDSKHLYAGATGISDHLTAFFFMNRSVSDANWTIKNSTKTVATGKIGDLTYASNDSYVVNNDAGIAKSWLSSETDGYSMHRGYAGIDVSKIAEGDYTLEFSFTLLGTKTVQTKSYTLTIDKTAPTLTNVIEETTDTGTYLTVQSKGANFSIKVGVTVRTPTLVEGTTDVYQTRVKLTTKQISADKIMAVVTDYAHNSQNILIHPSTMDFSIGSTFFTDNNDFTISEYDPTNHAFSVNIYDKNGKEIATQAGQYYIYYKMDKGLNADNILVRVDGDPDCTYTYDADSGFLIITMPKDASFFSVNVSTPTPDPETSSVVESSTQPTSSVTPTLEKKGCCGSVVAASSTLGALVLLAGALALKKKREQK